MEIHSFEVREYFHLLMLKELNKRLSGRDFALKGGVYLRLFLSSPRLSEDIDFDIDPKMQINTPDFVSCKAFYEGASTERPSKTRKCSDNIYGETS